MQVGVETDSVTGVAIGMAPSPVRGIAGRPAHAGSLPPTGLAPRPDAIDRAIARIKAGLPGRFAAADAAAVEAGAAHLLSLPRHAALRRIAERIYDPHGFALRSPDPKPAAIMLDDCRSRLAAERPAGRSDDLDPVWHERRSRRLAWQECRHALIAIVHDGEADGDSERRIQARLSMKSERL